MELDTISKIYIVKHETGDYIKMNIYPSKDLLKKMPSGTVALDVAESRRLFAALRAYFENTDYPPYMEVKDLRQLQRSRLENNRFERERVSVPMNAQRIQEENMRNEGRLPEKTLGDIAEIKKKGVDIDGRER